MKKYIFILIFPSIVLAQFWVGGTTKRIDEIQNESQSNIVLKPTNFVEIDYFTGEKALQSTASGELEESSVVEVSELSNLDGSIENIQASLDLKALKATLINTTPPLSGGGDLSTDRTLVISQADSITDGYLSSTDWNTFNNKQSALTGTDGDLYYWNSGLANLGIGLEDQVLTVSSLGFPEWADPPVSTTLDTKGQIQGYSTQNANIGPCVDDQILIYDDLEATGWKCGSQYQSPTTTEGDIIVRGATEDERLPIGANGTFLKSNGTTLVYDTVTATPAFTVVQKTSSATLSTSGEDHVLCDSTLADVTLTLPAASGNNGLTYKIKKQVNDNNCIIDTTGGVGIDGELQIVMPTREDFIIVSSNGTNWNIFGLNIDVQFNAVSNNGQTCYGDTDQRIEYEDEQFDTHDYYNPATGTFQVTDTYNQGYYLCCAGAHSDPFDAESAGDDGRLRLWRNDSAYRQVGYQEISDPNSGMNWGHYGCAVIPLTTSDHVEVRGQHDDVNTSCSSSQQYNHFSCQLINRGL